MRSSMLLLLLLLLASRCHPLLLHLLLLLPFLQQRRRRRRRRRSRRKKGKRIAGGRRPKPLRAVATATPEKPPSALLLPRLLPPLRPGASCGVMLDRRHVYRGEKRVSACVCGIRDETKRKGLPSDRACQSAPRLSFFFFSLTCHCYCCCSPRRAALRPSGPGARRGWRDASKEGSGESGRGSKEQTKKIIEMEITLSRRREEKKTRKKLQCWLSAWLRLPEQRCRRSPPLLPPPMDPASVSAVFRLGHEIRRGLAQPQRRPL